MKDFIAILLFINVTFSIGYRLRFQSKIPSIMSKYKNVFDTMDIDKFLMVIPELCPVKKLLEKIPQDNEELTKFFMQLKKTRRSLFPSFFVLFLYGFLFLR